MALPNQNTTGTAIPVALISEWTAGRLIQAVQKDTITLDDGTEASPVDFFAALFEVPDDPMNPPPGSYFAVMILNALRTPLSLVEMSTPLVHGYQDAYPAVSNLKGSTLTMHEIPASRSHPLDPTATRYGAGMWGFSSAGNGVEGAVALCYNGNLTDPSTKQAVGPFVGVSWRFGTIFWSDRYGVTADVAGKYSSLDGFYQKTIVSASDSTFSEIGGDVAVMCRYAYRDLQSGRGVCSCLMVYVRYKLPGE